MKKFLSDYTAELVMVLIILISIGLYFVLIASMFGGWF